MDRAQKSLLEVEAIMKLKARGYVVEVLDLTAETFPEKYEVYKRFGQTKRYAIVNDQGQVIAEQG